MEFVTGGPPLSTKVWPYLVRGHATEVIPTWSWSDDLGREGDPIPPMRISLAGVTLDASGEGVTLFQDNTTNDFTPVITGFSNYTYSAYPSKVKVELYFRNSGELTSRQTMTATGREVGYQTNIYDALTNLFGTISLGAANPPANGLFFNFPGNGCLCPNQCILRQRLEISPGRSMKDFLLASRQTGRDSNGQCARFFARHRRRR